MLNIVDLLFPPRVDELTLRNVSDDEVLSLIAPRLVPHTRPGTIALLPFSDVSVRAALHEAKYHGSSRAFALLGLVLAEYLRDTDALAKHLVLAPIPLGKARRKERGCNQVEEITRAALKHLGADTAKEFTLEPDLLARARETTSQVSLPRHEREENMRGAFIASPKLEERKRVDPACMYILIDDVTTTGATLQAAIDALVESGIPSSSILPLALAH